MHPFITQSIAAGRTRDMRQAAGTDRDARLARARRQRERRAAQARGGGRQLPARLRPRLCRKVYREMVTAASDLW